MGCLAKAPAYKLILIAFLTLLLQSHEELWLECANKLTLMIQQIIEFAKMVPGFMKLSQDDQIVLLKTASFELSCIRMSRYYDLNTSNVLFGDLLMPMDALMTTGKFSLLFSRQSMTLNHSLLHRSNRTQIGTKRIRTGQGDRRTETYRKRTCLILSLYSFVSR